MFHALVEDVEHGVVFVKTDFQSCVGTEGDVAKDDSQSDRHQEERFEVFLYGEPDEDASHQYHDEVSCRGVGEARIGQELIEVLYDEIHNLNYKL